VLHLTGYKHQGFYGRSYTVKKDMSMNDILQRVGFVINAQQDVVKDTILRNEVEFISGMASFTTEPHVLKVGTSFGVIFHYGDTCSDHDRER
jgi:NAD(P) transhydrogenase